MSATPDLSTAQHESVPAPPALPARRRAERWPTVVTAVALALLAAFIVYAVTRAHRAKTTFAPASLSVLPKGSVAPEFDLARLGGGPRVRLTSFRGKPTVINFFASWCPDCRAELGAFGAVSRATAGQVHFVGVDANDSDPTLARQLLSRAGATYPVGVDPYGTLTSSKYLSTHLPVSFFVSATGRIVGEAYGAQSRASLERWISLLESGHTGGT